MLIGEVDSSKLSLVRRVLNKKEATSHQRRLMVFTWLDEWKAGIEQSGGCFLRLTCAKRPLWWVNGDILCCVFCCIAHALAESDTCRICILKQCGLW
jgi:hypothetical protein